jgi:NitT/TauT family transport system permease protein
MAVDALNSAAPQASEDRVRRSKRVNDNAARWTIRVVVAVAILLFWQLDAEHLSTAVSATPIETVKAVWRQFITQGTIYSELVSSLEALVIGYAISVVAGLAIGIAMGRSRIVERVLDPYVSFLYALPHVAFVPLMVIWLGFQLKLRLGYVILSAIFPMIVNTMVGAKNVDEALLDVGRSVCASRRQSLRTIVLPAAMPYILLGARQAFFLAWVGVVVAEVLTTQTGLGGALTHYSNYYRTADMFVPILVIMAIGIVIQIVTDRAKRRIAPWSDGART